MSSETRWFTGCTKELTINGFVACGYGSKEIISKHCTELRKLLKECKRCKKEPFKATIEYTIKREAVAN
jgi:hypothetical protein